MDPQQLQPIAPRSGLTAPLVDRRSCARLIISLLGVLSLGGSLDPRRGRLTAADLASWLTHSGAGRIGNPMALGHLGAIYLALHPGERHPERLAQLILRDSTDPVESVLIQSIARDWASHDVTQVDGWMLSRTEARICAVVHLMDGRPG